jgi:hypothetical protein
MDIRREIAIEAKSEIASEAKQPLGTEFLLCRGVAASP